MSGNGIVDANARTPGQSGGQTGQTGHLSLGDVRCPGVRAGARPSLQRVSGFL